MSQRFVGDGSKMIIVWNVNGKKMVTENCAICKQKCRFKKLLMLIKQFV